MRTDLKIMTLTLAGALGLAAAPAVADSAMTYESSQISASTKLNDDNVHGPNGLRAGQEEDSFGVDGDGQGVIVERRVDRRRFNDDNIHGRDGLRAGTEERGREEVTRYGDDEPVALQEYNDDSIHGRDGLSAGVEPEDRS